jgi:hypothetical protein
MKRLIEIFKYGDSESIEIWLSIFLILEVTCYLFQLHTYEAFTIIVSTIVLGSASFLIVGSILHNCNIRKKASYVTSIGVLALVYYIIAEEIGDLENYVLLSAQAISFMWIAWKNATEEKIQKLTYIKRH